MANAPFTLVGVDGNAFSIMAYVKHAMKKARFSDSDKEAYIKDAMGSNYDHLLSVSIDMIDKVNKTLFGDSYDEDDSCF